MAIVPLVKVTLYGPAGSKDELLDGLQRLGCLHVNDLRPARADAADAADGEPALPDAREALRYLSDSPVRRRPLRRKESVDVAAVIKEAHQVRERARALDEEREQLRKWIADLEPWGDFELPGWATEGALRFWFYIVPLHELQRLDSISEPWRVVSRDHRFAYVVMVTGDQPSGMPVAPTPLRPHPLGKLRERLLEVESELEELDYRRIGLTLYSEVVRQSLDETDDLVARRNAAARALERDQLFAVQGWAPLSRAADLRRFGAERKLALTLEPPGPQERPPTLLDNPPALRGGEDLVKFYVMPPYRLWDPSKAVFFSFAAFFAMIFSDAGYAALLGIVLCLIWRRAGGTASGRGLREVMLALVIFSGIYGILVGTYFGVSPPAGSWLTALHVLDAGNQRLMMWIAIGIGTAHVTCANLIAAWCRRRSSTALSALGWAALILGGFCVALARAYPGMSSLASAGWWALAIGGGLVLLFTSERPFSLAPARMLGRLMDGVKGATGISKAFGDVLSYLRLFALGLASIKLAEAFNHLAAPSFTSGGAWVLLGVLVLIIGHGINFAMGIMSGVVHGLRLNVIEFFNWSLPEEGEPFKPFEKKSARPAE